MGKTTTVPQGVSEKLGSILKEHVAVAERSFGLEQARNLQQIAAAMIDTFRKNGKILLCGNGGSAADAQHIAAEFIVRFKKERRSLPAIALTTDSSVLTATANDYDYDLVFRRQVEGLGNLGDLLIAISTSGNSKNVIEAVKAAKTKKMTTVSFTGKSGGALKPLTDYNFSAASTETSHIQEMHITALHAISEVVEDVLARS